MAKQGKITIYLAIKRQVMKIVVPKGSATEQRPEGAPQHAICSRRASDFSFKRPSFLYRSTEIQSLMLILHIRRAREQPCQALLRNYEWNRLDIAPDNALRKVGDWLPHAMAKWTKSRHERSRSSCSGDLHRGRINLQSEANRGHPMKQEWQRVEVRPDEIVGMEVDGRAGDPDTTRRRHRQARTEVRTQSRVTKKKTIGEIAELIFRRRAAASEGGFGRSDGERNRPQQMDLIIYYIFLKK